MKPAFGYVRVSGKGQLHGDGFQRQKLAIEAYAAKHSLRIVKIFYEKAVPGATELDNRPALGELLEALAANGTKIVLIERLDRLARDLMVQETILGDLRKRGFELVSVHEPDLCSNDPSRVMMRQIFGAIAQYDKAMIVAKLRGARDRKRAATGRCEGRPFYGHYDGEQNVIARMRELRATGLTYDRVAERMNAEGLPTRSRGRWHAMMVHRVLKREAS
jgi:DNA invertase Pin-like site-specific DNA recombinase